ncbi:MULTISPECIES: CPBP family intramembrane glutamic endopeptidase [Enterococcus]|uniref:CPBP family intramembrane glutamic endopeptidase n=1 Tax=Enterococcus TaxID=1350 RepID=UPI000EE0E7A8|nr:MULTISPECIES: CPBP family intramembrane glutamic endopeptidase [Enterococcus]HCM87424.1 CPBP family intramembrane metalloprotease [Enterococcus sp.]
MDKILNKQVSFKNIGIATAILIAGLAILLFGPGYLGFFSVAATSLIALLIVYPKKSVQAIFGKPLHPVKIIIGYFLLNWLVSIVVSLLLNYGLGWHLQGNPINDNPNWLLLFTIPIMLMGEELLSIYFLSIFSSKFSLPIASLLSALIFGLIHYSTYNDGNVLHTLAHILLIQGVARLIFNRAAIKTNSIWTSWIIHVLFDFSTILLVLFQH